MSSAGPQTMEMETTAERWVPPPYQGGGQGEVGLAQDELLGSTAPSPSLVRRGIFRGVLMTSVVELPRS